MVKVREDLTDKVFNKLTVLHQAEDYISPNGKHFAQWFVQCNCNRSEPFIAQTSDIKRGKVYQCKMCKEDLYYQTRKKYNDSYEKANVTYIKLSNCEDYTKVDTDKYNTVFGIKELCWHKNGSGYVEANIPKRYRSIFNKCSIGLHNLVCPCEEGYEPDHLDRNKLNNLNNNLIPKTHIENSKNIDYLIRKIPKHNTSGVKGVIWYEKQQKWIARINIQGTRIHLGSFKNKQDAINARKQAEIKYFGECKYQNL